MDKAFFLTSYFCYCIILQMITVGILTISDRIAKKIKEDRSLLKMDESGVLIGQILSKELKIKIAAYEIVPDDKSLIKQKLCWLSEQLKLNLIFTTGGTGFAPRDVTPEATREILEKEAPLFAQAMLLANFKKSPTSILSRGTAGMRKSSLIINLPGSPQSVKECLEIILPVLPHAIDILLGKVTRHKINRVEM